jgi:nitrite reductase/ring-hydroxylating ferredoxin subunit
VFATNSPTSDWVEIHSKMGPYRTYAMAFSIPQGSLPDALYWDMADPYHYVRIQPGRGSSSTLIVGGADHKSGEADDGAVRFEALEAWIRELIPNLGKEVARWSGQVMDTIDYCGFIGRDPSRKRTFIATGDSGQGMTHGALAGIILKNLVIYGASEWSDVYDPARKPVSTVMNFVGENVTAIKNFAEYLMPAEISSTDELKPGQGGIMRDGTSKIAVCRDTKGAFHARSAVCTHLGCHVHWNSTEQCWDCPCHGSQFGADGEVLNGPAIAPLAEATLPGVKHAKANVSK